MRLFAVKIVGTSFLFLFHVMVFSDAAGAQNCQPGNLSDLISALHMEDVSDRLRAVRSLEKLGCGAEGSLNALEQAMVSPVNDSIRPEIAITIGKIGPPATKAIPTLSRFLHDSSPAVRLEVAAAIIRIAGQSVDAERTLEVLLTDESIAVQQLTIFTVAEIGSPLHGLVPTLINLVRSQDSNVRQGAIIALGRMGSAAKHALPVLAMVAEEKNQDTSRLAEVSLAAINSDIPKLLNALDEKEEMIKILAAACIGDLGPSGRPYIDSLRRKLKSEEEPSDFQNAVRQAIQRIESVNAGCCDAG